MFFRMRTTASGGRKRLPVIVKALRRRLHASLTHALSDAVHYQLGRCGGSMAYSNDGTGNTPRRHISFLVRRGPGSNSVDRENAAGTPLGPNFADRWRALRIPFRRPEKARWLC
ncbi:hypothetical protein MRX96_038684 [Rhipicephalus microplus]